MKEIVVYAVVIEKYPGFVVNRSDEPLCIICAVIEKFSSPDGALRIETNFCAVFCDESTDLHRKNDLCCCKS